MGRLADFSDVTVGIDPDPASLAAATQLLLGGGELIQGDFLDYDFGTSKFDLVTAVASIHHMPLDHALQKMASLLRPGGAIGVVGLYRSATLSDRAVELAAIPVNAALAWTRPSPVMAAQACDPTMTLEEIRSAAARILPGAKMRRLLLWRYLLTWRAPTTS